MELPKQPDTCDFVDNRDYLRPAYYDALKAWKDVCQMIIAAERPKCDGNHAGPRCADPECWNQ